MTAPTESTLAILINVADQMPGPTRSDLTTLLERAGLSRYASGGKNKQELLRRPFQLARIAAERGDVAAHRALLTFISLLVARKVTDPENPPFWFGDLREALRGDGYELTWDRVSDETRPTPFGGTQKTVKVSYEILPTDAAPVPLAPEISALEKELARRGYATALNHYQQAVDGLLNQKYESANGDLRAALEDLVTRLAEDHAGYQRIPGPSPGQPRANQGGPAINHLVQQGNLPEREGGKLLQGLWDMIHTNGPHPGQSDADEARFRSRSVLSGLINESTPAA